MLATKGGNSSNERGQFLCATVLIGYENEFAKAEHLPVTHIKSRFARRVICAETGGRKVVQHFRRGDGDSLLYFHNAPALLDKICNRLLRFRHH